MKQINKVITDKYLYNKITFCVLFLYTIFEIRFNSFLSEKKFLSSGNKVFKVDVNFIKEIISIGKPFS